MLPFFESMAILTAALPTLDRFRWQWLWVRAESLIAMRQPGRAIADRQTIHVSDLQAAEAEFPGAKTRGIAMGVRTVLVTPLLREGIAIGAIHIRRREVRPFSDRQIKLLETFADQAVIAIENARLIHEQQARNRELTEALEQQTATSEILRVIASSPTDIQPVLDTLIANAVKLSGAQGHVRQVDGEFYRVVAHYGESLEMDRLPSAVIPLPRARRYRWPGDGQTRPVHILDGQVEPETNSVVFAPDWRTNAC